MSHRHRKALILALAIGAILFALLAFTSAGAHANGDDKKPKPPREDKKPREEKKPRPHPRPGDQRAGGGSTTAAR